MLNVSSEGWPKVNGYYLPTLDFILKRPFVWILTFFPCFRRVLADWLAIDWVDFRPFFRPDFMRLDAFLSG